MVELRTNGNSTRNSGEHGSDIIIVITSYDAHNLDTTNGALLVAELKNNGATARVSDSSSAYHRVPYILIGVAGCGEGNGIEVMTGLAATDPHAEYFGTLVDGEIRGVIDSLRDGVIINNGGITMDSGGVIKGGQTGYDTGTGFFLGYDSAYKFSIETVAGIVTFDGQDLSVTGAITAQSGSIASSVTIGSTAASTVESGASAGASAIQPGDDITSGSVGAVTITSSSLYHHSGATTPAFGNENTAFYLDSSGNF